MAENAEVNASSVLETLNQMSNDNVLFTHDNFVEHFGDDNLDKLSSLSSDDKHEILMWLVNTANNVDLLGIDFYNLFGFTHDDLNDMKVGENNIVSVFDNKATLFGKIVSDDKVGDDNDIVVLIGKVDDFFTDEDFEGLKNENDVNILKGICQALVRYSRIKEACLNKFIAVLKEKDDEVKKDVWKAWVKEPRYYLELGLANKKNFAEMSFDDKVNLLNSDDFQKYRENLNRMTIESAVDVFTSNFQIAGENLNAKVKVVKASKGCQDAAYPYVELHNKVGAKKVAWEKIKVNNVQWFDFSQKEVKVALSLVKGTGFLKDVCEGVISLSDFPGGDDNEKRKNCVAALSEKVKLYKNEPKKQQAIAQKIASSGHVDDGAKKDFAVNVNDIQGCGFLRLVAEGKITAADFNNDVNALSKAVANKLYSYGFWTRSGCRRKILNHYERDPQVKGKLEAYIEARSRFDDLESQEAVGFVNSRLNSETTPLLEAPLLNNTDQTK